MTLMELVAGLQAPAAPGFDSEAATRAYLATLDGAARDRSDAYFEGGYWLILVNFLVGVGISLAFLQLGWAKGLRDGIGKVLPGFLTTPLFAAAYLFLTALIALPLAIWRDFVREHAYGLSTMGFGEWIAEWGMQLAISVVFGALFLWLFYAVVRATKAAWWLWGAGLSVVFMAFAIFISPVYVDPLFNDYTPMEEGDLRDDILAIAAANGVPADDVYVFDVSRQSNRITANVSGLGETTRIALSDTLIDNTDPDEVLAVMGHEIGHYALNHLWEIFAVMALVLMLGFAVTNGLFGWINRVFGRKWGVSGVGDVAGLPLLSICLSIYFLAATPVMNTLTRSNEAEADIFGLNAARAPDGFATVSLRLSTYRKIEPGPLEEWFFFDHPSGMARVSMAMEWKAAQLAAGAADQTPELRLDRAEAIAASVAPEEGDRTD